MTDKMAITGHAKWSGALAALSDPDRDIITELQSRARQDNDLREAMADAWSIAWVAACAVGYAGYANPFHRRVLDATDPDR